MSEKVFDADFSTPDLTPDEIKMILANIAIQNGGEIRIPDAVWKRRTIIGIFQDEWSREIVIRGQIAPWPAREDG